MKVTLISPYSVLYVFGLRTLSARLKQEGHTVDLLFLPRYFLERYGDRVLNKVVRLAKGSDLIGISLMTNFFDNVVQITQKLKGSLNIPVLWGGIHPTIRPEECLDYADMVCIGEGEETLIELLRKMEDGQDYHDVQSIWFRDKENIIRNKLRPLIQDLDSIPFPDYDYGTHYVLSNDGCVHKMNKELLNHYYMGGTYVTLTTRGCPFGCSYCCNNTLNKMYPNQKPLRKRSINNIIKELMNAKSRFPFIERIKFDDDSFFMYTIGEITEFCEKYKENIGLPLMITGVTPSTFTREKLSFLVDAGLTRIRVGIQTGSERTKRLYKRYHPNQQVEKVVRTINEYKDKIRVILYDIILDNPWETEEDLIETLMFLTKLPAPYALTLYSLCLYPETDLYRLAKRDGIITDDLKDVYRKYYHGCKKTYLNRLFFLLNEYARGRGRISPKMMSLLTNRKLRQLKLNWLLYILLKIGAIPFKIRRLVDLLYKSVKAIQKRDWFLMFRNWN